MGSPNNEKFGNENKCESEETGSLEKEGMLIGRGTGMPKIKMTIRKAHELLGHVNKDVVKSTAPRLGWELTRGTLGVYKACSFALCHL